MILSNTKVQLTLFAMMLAISVGGGMIYKPMTIIGVFILGGLIRWDLFAIFIAMQYVSQLTSTMTIGLFYNYISLIFDLFGSNGAIEFVVPTWAKLTITLVSLFVTIVALDMLARLANKKIVLSRLPRRWFASTKSTS